MIRRTLIHIVSVLLYLEVIMAKDDFYVIVCKILIYLYRRLKKKTKTEPKDYLIPLTKDFPIDEEYFQYILEKMLEKGYIERVVFVKAWGGDIISADIDKIRITPDGIDYLRNDSTMNKLAKVIPEAASIFSLFQGL